MSLRALLNAFEGWRMQYPESAAPPDEVETAELIAGLSPDQRAWLGIERPN